MALNAVQLRALQYVRNANGGATQAHFVEDHDPIGTTLWDVLFEGEPQYITVSHSGKIFLTEAGKQVLDAA